MRQSTIEQTAEPKDLYRLIEEEERQMTEISAEGSSYSIRDRIKIFVECSADNYQRLWKAKLYKEAEWLRTLAYHWAGIYTRITGDRISPGICTLQW